MLKRLQIALPKHIYWKIWLTHNKELFLKEKYPPYVVVGKDIGLLSKNLNSKVRK
jgi:hypothetical protein